MKRVLLSMPMLLLAAGLRAQNPEPAPVAPEPQDPQQERVYRERVETAFGSMVQRNLDLNDQEMAQVRTALRANQDRRIAINRRQQDIRLAMARQMQPGQAADADSVSRMTEALSRLRVERAQSDDQLVRDLGFLPPVKRARLMNMMQRFEDRVQEIRRHSAQGGQPRPMARPMPGAARPGGRRRI